MARCKMVIRSLAAALVLVAGPAFAAEEWGIEFEEKARFEAKVVDILCELSGDCPDNCGGGVLCDGASPSWSERSRPGGRRERAKGSW